MVMVSSCAKEKIIFERYHKLDNQIWDRFNQVVFNVPVTEAGKEYDISLILKPTNEFIYNTMPVYVILTSPSGEERMTDVKIPVKKDGKFIGAEEGKPVVISSALWKALTIQEAGKLKLSVENMVPKIQTAGIAEIGLLVEHARK